MALMDQLSVVAFPWGKQPPTVDDLVDVARKAEELGFYSVNVPMVNASLRGDHLFSRSPTTTISWTRSLS
jgi:alkanesulfonate monooxygenase SsuD/methylene tetrahydromethanopterin reductase-like flavin-dependent oxidoreductase (luciferase family)